MYTCRCCYGLKELTGDKADAAFSVEVNDFTFGSGCLREADSGAVRA